MDFLLLAVNWIATALACLLHLRRRSFLILDPAWAFLGGYFINYCLRPALYSYDHDIGGLYQGWLYPDSMISAGFSRAMIFSLLAICAFMVADSYFDELGVKFARRLPTISFRGLASSRAYWATCFAFLLLGCLGVAGFVREAGWSGPLLELLSGTSRDEFLKVIQGHGYFTFAMQLSIVGWGMICIRWIGFAVQKHGLRRFGQILLRLSWMLATLAVWLCFGERASIITVLFVPIALYFVLTTGETAQQQRARQRMKWLVVIVIIATILVAGPIGLLMKGKEVDPVGIVGMSISAWDAFEFTIAAQQYIHLGDVHLGSTYLGDVFYTWLPRTWFPDKPERYGAVTVQDMVAPDLVENVGATFPTGYLVEAFANFWYFGLLLVPMLYAFVAHAVAERLRQKDWFWILQVVILFPALGSFRSLGWVIAAAMAYTTVFLLAVITCRLLLFFRSALAGMAVPSNGRLHVARS